MRAEQEAGEHEQSRKEEEHIAGEEHGNLFLQEDVVVHPPELVDEGDRPADGLHDPEDAEATAGGDGVANESDDEGKEEQGRGNVADCAEGYTAREERGGGELDESEDDRRCNPKFCGLAHNAGPHFSMIDYRQITKGKQGRKVVAGGTFGSRLDD